MQHKYAIRATRSNLSVMGYATALCKGSNGALALFESEGEAIAKAKKWNGDLMSGNVNYTVEEYND